MTPKIVVRYGTDAQMVDALVAELHRIGIAANRSQFTADDDSVATLCEELDANSPAGMGFGCSPSDPSALGWYPRKMLDWD
jgi:hypothetical protein